MGKVSSRTLTEAGGYPSTLMASFSLNTSTNNTTVILKDQRAKAFHNVEGWVYIQSGGVGKLAWTDSVAGTGLDTTPVTFSVGDVLLPVKVGCDRAVIQWTSGTFAGVYHYAGHPDAV